MCIRDSPGGVNSPVRAYRAVGMAPRFITRADGAYIYDEDGKRYIDYVCSWGPMILGHNHPVIREAVDVYKRQGWSWSSSAPPTTPPGGWWTGRCCGRRRSNAGPWGRCWRWTSAFCPSPVSYTHLDVYKRQAEWQLRSSEVERCGVPWD